MTLKASGTGCIEQYKRKGILKNRLVQMPTRLLGAYAGRMAMDAP